jgi:hypothetical protein
MTSHPRLLLFLLALPLLAPGVCRASASDEKAKPVTLQFAGADYFFRWSQEQQFEFTPKGQEDLERWNEMITFHRFHDVRDGDGLAARANAVLENYKANRAMVVRTDAVPRTEEKPAEYLIVVLFPRPDFIEAVFARFKLVDGIGTAVIYSHREYGKGIGGVMSTWLQANGPSTEKALMTWDQFSSLQVLGQSNAQPGGPASADTAKPAR